MSIKEVKYSMLRSIGNVLLGKAVSLVCRSLRVEIVNDSKLKDFVSHHMHFVIAFWHSTMLYPWYHHANMNFHGLTSQSKDGELLARILHKWNYKVVRGSSSRGGKVALGILVDLLKYEGAVAITPDGPRGPMFEFKPGAVIAAQRANVPLLLLGVGYEKKFVLKRSWDKFQIPKPFSRVKLVYGSTIMIDPEANRQQVSDIIWECQKELIELQKKAESF